MLCTCLFDLGNVLANFSHERMCRQMAAVCQTAPEDIRRLLFDSGLELAFECGRISEQEVHGRLTELFGPEINFEDLVHAGSDIFEVNSAMTDIVRALKRQGLRLVLLSNTNSAHIRHLRREFGLLNEFDACVLSYEVGAVKPEPAIFQAALRAIRCRPDECFYTDDIADYVAAGRKHGLQAEVFTSPAELVRHLRDRGVSV